MTRIDVHNIFSSAMRHKPNILSQVIFG